MTGFAFLSDDRLLQQTTFEDGTVITVNFDRQPRRDDGRRCRPRSRTGSGAPGQGPQMVEAEACSAPPEEVGGTAKES